MIAAPVAFGKRKIVPMKAAPAAALPKPEDPCASYERQKAAGAPPTIVEALRRKCGAPAPAPKVFGRSSSTPSLPAAPPPTENPQIPAAPRPVAVDVPPGSGAAPATYADAVHESSSDHAPNFSPPSRGVAPAATFSGSVSAPDWAIVAGGVVLAAAAAWYAAKKGLFKRKAR